MTVEELITALRIYPQDCSVLVTKSDLVFGDGTARLDLVASPVTEIVVDEVRRTVELVAD